MGDSRTAGCTVRVVPHFICCSRISSGRALPRLPCNVAQNGRVFAPRILFHLLLRLPLSFFAMLDVPRDKYGDEFDAVRERTSSVPFQVRCLRSLAQVSTIVRRGVHLMALTLSWRLYTAGIENVLRKSGLCQVPLLCGCRQPSQILFRWHIAPQRFTQQRIALCDPFVAHAYNTARILDTPPCATSNVSNRPYGKAVSNYRATTGRSLLEGRTFSLLVSALCLSYLLCMRASVRDRNIRLSIKT